MQMHVYIYFRHTLNHADDDETFEVQNKAVYFVNNGDQKKKACKC